jgi:hypothetical protein
LTQKQIRADGYSEQTRVLREKDSQKEQYPNSPDSSKLNGEKLDVILEMTVKLHLNVVVKPYFLMGVSN